MVHSDDQNHTSSFKITPEDTIYFLHLYVIKLWTDATILIGNETLLVNVFYNDIYKVKMQHEGQFHTWNWVINTSFIKISLAIKKMTNYISFVPVSTECAHYGEIFDKKVWYFGIIGFLKLKCLVHVSMKTGSSIVYFFILQFYICSWRS